LPKRLRDGLVSISLANLCFLSSWLILLNPSHYVYYFWKDDPGFTELITLVVLILLLAIVFWSLRRFAGSRLTRWIFLLVLTWPINSFLIDYAKVSVIEKAIQSRWSLLALVAVTVVLLFLGWRDQKRMIAITLFVLVVLSPLILVNTTVALWLRHKHPITQDHTHNQSAGVAHVDSPRIVWVIFDELQMQSVFENRVVGLQLPEFDRLIGESLILTNAYPPSWQTLTSMPALISGRFVRDAVPANRNELQLETDDGSLLKWSTQSSVFSQAQKEGFTTGLAGWYHPYCRLIGNDLDSCYWSPQVGQANPALDRLTFGRALLNHTITAVLRIPFFFRIFHNIYEARQRDEHARALAEVETNAKKLETDRPNLSLLHFPVPHSPWINERTVDPKSVKAYLGNVVVADRVLGDLRRSMGGDWDNAVVLVSSDHWWRDAPLTNGKRDHRIPFILKLAGQKQGIEYKGTFNTVLTRELLLQSLRGEVKKPSEVVEWIERNSRLGESPLTVNAP
jgi:hypothetical protein